MIIRNILVINVNWVGDVIFSSPIFKALKRKYPDSRIACMVPPRVQGVAESITDIDEVIIYDEKGKHRGPFAKLSLLNQIKKRRFQVAFILHRSFTRALFPFWARIPHRVGYDTKGRTKLLTHIVEPLEVTAHRADHYLNVIESYGVPIEDRRSIVSVSVESDNCVSKILQDFGFSDNEQFIVINPGGNWDLKRWPLNNYSLLINNINSETGMKVVIAGAPKDIKLAQKIKNGSSGEVYITAGKTTIKDAIALMNKAKIVVSADSGPLHLANSVGAETIGIFGPTSPRTTGPRGCGHSVVLKHDVGCNREPCYFLDCKDNVCMKAISVDQVFREIKHTLKN